MEDVIGILQMQTTVANLPPVWDKNLTDGTEGGAITDDEVFFLMNTFVISFHT